MHERPDDDRPDPRVDSPGDGPAPGSDGDLNVSPASPADLDDPMPAWQPGEGEGPTPGE